MTSFRLKALARLSASAALLAAGSAGAAGLDGGALAPWWGAPFAGLLLSIALLPAALPGLWHRHYVSIALIWVLAFAVPAALWFGVDGLAAELVRVLLLDYLPFVILIGASYVVGGCMRLSGWSGGTPAANTAMLAVGTLLAGLIGATCASMLLIRPLLDANRGRQQKAHLVVFLIFLVGNIGGGLTPLGNPPVFLAFLEGVDFFWTLVHLGPPILLVSAVLLGAFFLIDRCWYNWEAAAGLLQSPAERPERTRLEGGDNLMLLLALALVVLFQSVWRPGLGLTVGGVYLPLQTLVGEGLMLAIAGLSLALTGQALRRKLGFSWRPLIEVAVLFAAIFITVVPILASLRAGGGGVAGEWVAGLAPAHLFWVVGGLSSVLDNAPTWLVFFQALGGDADRLMAAPEPTLLAITMGAVFMGATTYIGNAPNLMMKAIAEERGVSMPSFFVFVAWAAVLLLPLFGLLTVIWF